MGRREAHPTGALQWSPAEHDGEAAAARIAPRTDFNCRAVQAGDFLDDAQAQAAPVTIRAWYAVEPLENPDTLVFGYSRAIILYGQLGLQACLDNHRHPARRLAVTQGVVDQVGQELTEQPVITSDPYGGVRDDQAEIDIALQSPGDPLFANAPCERDQVQWLELNCVGGARIGTGEREELLAHPSRSLDRAM